MLITIITPAYNRADLLMRAYNSLKTQTSYNFEWIIIDDGSTDDTQEVVQKFLKEKNFKVSLITQENGGKHRALNNGIKKAIGEYILILDSDDYLDTDAVLSIKKWAKTINKHKSFAGVAGLKAHQNGRVVGGKIPNSIEYIDASNIERNKYKLNGDKAEVYRAEILCKYPFPEIKGEKFIDEAIVWDKIAADGYKIRWFNKSIYYCEYIAGGLTSLGYDRYLNSFKGYTKYINQRIRLYKGLDRLKSVGVYAHVAKKKDLNFGITAKRLNISSAIVIIAYYLKQIKDVIDGEA